jgi:lipopolysaccharide/colanic/teichoic acid biosynthesis glycosyltransferase
VKRAFDIVVSALSLFLLAPMLVAIAIAIRREDGGPAIFRQQRVGHNGQPFDILKFRTMQPMPGGPSITAAGDSRITVVGRWLRRWKLDELPQLWNVLRGEMSIVGPRPEVLEYVHCYPAEGRQVLSVRPGITGPSQLIGIDEEEELRQVPDPERYYREVLLPRKLATDLEYARSPGLVTDLRILWKTASRLVGASSSASRRAFDRRSSGDAL